MKKILLSSFLVIISLFIFDNSVFGLELPPLPQNTNKYIYVDVYQEGYRLFAWNNQVNQFNVTYETPISFTDCYVQFNSSNPNSEARIAKYKLNNGEWEFLGYVHRFYTNSTNRSYGNVNIIDNSGSEFITNTMLADNPASDIIGKHNIKIHLNGGTLRDNYSGNNQIYSEIFEINYQEKNLTALSTHIILEKLGMYVEGIYYDSNFLNEINESTDITTDLELYVKWIFVDSAEIIKNINFDSYTFNQNYEYLTISNKENVNKLYFAFEYNITNFEVYNYDIETDTYQMGADLCPQSFLYQNGYFYYVVDTSQLNTSQVIMIPKSKLIVSNSGYTNTYFNFKVSTNGFISYTSDLEEVVIKDRNGNEHTTNINETYTFSQDALLNQNSNLIDIFNDLFKNKNNAIFGFINQIWNLIKTSKLYLYIFACIIGSLIIMIIKSANRS